MRSHGNTNRYFVVGHGTVELTAHASGGFDVQVLPDAAAPAAGAAIEYKFKWMFGRSKHNYTDDVHQQLMRLLEELGRSMTTVQAVPAEAADISTITSGYTYLGQFLAHEISFDREAPWPPVGTPTPNLRSPEIDLDSLYGVGPQGADLRLYQEADHQKLKVGTTIKRPEGLNIEFPNDLPRDPGKNDPQAKGRAVIGDKRNDENLVVAQLHVALISFHNRVVDELRKLHHPEEEVFDRARREVVLYFQWVILHDYLPRLVETGVLDRVRDGGLGEFSVLDGGELCMPLEFSVACLRVGHSMVRDSYEWNKYHFSGYPNKPATLRDLFQRTRFSGDLAGLPRLASDWVIDWRRFFHFKDFGGKYGKLPDQINMAKKLDTVFHLDLSSVITSFGDSPLAQQVKMQQLVAIRNLQRGFALGLPTGEEVAEFLGETPVPSDVVTGGMPADLRDTFNRKTPLWYYILKEAEQSPRNGNQLGPVGGTILAATLYEIIRHSRHSVLREGWEPKDGCQGTNDFKMVDLLDFAGVVDPIGKAQGDHAGV